MSISLLLPSWINHCSYVLDILIFKFTDPIPMITSENQLTVRALWGWVLSSPPLTQVAKTEREWAAAWVVTGLCHPHFHRKVSKWTQHLVPGPFPSGFYLQERYWGVGYGTAKCHLNMLEHSPNPVAFLRDISIFGEPISFIRKLCCFLNPTGPGFGGEALF